MFGFPRLKDAVARYPGGGELIDRVLGDLGSTPGRTPSRRTTSPWSRCPVARRDSGADGRRRAPAGRVRGAERRGQRAAGAASGSARSSRRSGWRGPARAARDRRRRSHDERDGARQPVPRRPAGDGPRRHATPTASGSRSPTRAARPGGRRPRCPTSRPSSPACSGPRLGPLPDQEHGRRGARVDRRDEHAGAGDALELVMSLEGGSMTMTTSEPDRPSATRDGVAVIDLVGDVDRRAEAAWTRPGPRRRARRRPRWSSNFAGHRLHQLAPASP